MNQTQRRVLSAEQGFPSRVLAGGFQGVAQGVRGWVWSVVRGSPVLPELFSLGPAASHRAVVKKL